MKKILLILCALVCGTLAFAQEATYDGNLHIKVGNDDEGVQQGNVTVVYDSEDDHTIIDFTLHDLYAAGYHVGDITVKGIKLGDEEDGVATFSCTDDQDVTLSGGDFDSYGFLLTITVNMTGDISTDKVHANMDIAVSVIIVNLNITATFGYEDYLIVNTESGYYLGGGLDWGTHATEVGKPQFFLYEGQADGTYNLFGNQGGTSIGYADGTSLYVDGANPLTWELIGAEGGYYIACDDGYLTGNGFQKGVTLANTAGTTALWKLVTMDDVLATMDGATISNPVDVTPLIPAPEPKRADWGSSWVTSGYGTDNAANNVSLGQDGNTASCAESYHSNNGFDVRQTISSLPVGYYELTAQAFYRNDGGTVIPSMYITTGTSATDTSGSFENVHLPLHTTDAGNMETAYQELLEGLYPVSLPFIVDAEGEEFTVGFESNTTGDDQMWSIFGELGLLYMGTELPELTAVTGTMNVDVEAAMTAAITAYNNSKTSANYIAAEQAIFDAEESVAYYASITAIVENLDEAGLAEWNSSTSGQAYANLTLTDEDVSTDLIAAQKAQTTAGSDMTYAMENSGEWTAQSNNGLEYPISADLTITASYNGNGWSTGDVLWKTISGLQAGTYAVTFYGAANYANSGNTGTFLAGGATAFANDANESIDINYRSGGDYSGALKDDEYHSFTNVTVGDDGVLTFGMSANTTGQTGNWYLAKAVSLTLNELAENPYDYDVTWKLANPSFEVDNVVANLTADTNDGGTSRCTDGGDGAWTVTSLTGWNLTANSVSDLMSEKAEATDNSFGAPGKPADGTYMLYLRDAWVSATDKVSQSVTLPAGDYKLTVNSKCVSGASGHSVQLTVGENIASANLTISSTMPSEWNTTSVTFSLSAETTLDVAVSVAYGGESASGLSVLLDNFKLYSVEEIEKTISWTMTDAGWGTLILPFDATLVDGLTAYSCDGTEESTDEDGNAITVVSLEEVGQSITANTPYIVKGTAATYTFTDTPTNTVETYTKGIITGTLVDLAVAKGAALATDGTQYLLQYHVDETTGEEVDDGLAFYPIVATESAEATLDAYHCYLTPGITVNKLSIGHVGEETGIVAVESEALANDAIYDLSGRHVAKAVKGVYIQNGKKVLVK